MFLKVPLWILILCLPTLLSIVLGFLVLFGPPAAVAVIVEKRPLCRRQP